MEPSQKPLTEQQRQLAKLLRQRQRLERGVGELAKEDQNTSIDVRTVDIEKWWNCLD